MRIRAIVLSLACSLAASLAQAQSLIAHYQFNGNLNNSVTGESASAFGTLVEVTGSSSLPNALTTESGAWTWSGATAPGFGLRLPVSGLTGDMHTFSVGMVFKVSDVGLGGDWRRIIDFSNDQHEDGLYLTNGKLIAYGALSATEEGNFSANENIALVFTRNSSNVVKVYANGSTTPLFTKTAFFTEQFRILMDSNIRFFLDDNGGVDFSPAGAVYDIRIWNGELSSEQVGTYFAAIPEPSTYAAFGGLMALGFVLWHRRRRSAGKAQS